MQIRKSIWIVQARISKTNLVMVIQKNSLRSKLIKARFTGVRKFIGVSLVAQVIGIVLVGLYHVLQKILKFPAHLSRTQTSVKAVVTVDAKYLAVTSRSFYIKRIAVVVETKIESADIRIALILSFTNDVCVGKCEV